MKDKSLNIGFTYDLKSAYLDAGYAEWEVAEFDTQETIDGIRFALERLGHTVEPIGNVFSLLEMLHDGKRWDLVFNICEGLQGPCREAQVPVLLDMYNIPYVFSDGLILAVTLDKAITKRIVRDHGIATSPFLLVNSTDDLQSVDMTYPLFVKPVAEGTGKGIGLLSKADNFAALVKACNYQLATYKQAVLIEEFLPGREFTVGVLGHGQDAEILGVMEVHFLPHEQSGIYSYENKANYEDFIRYTVPEKDVYDACADVALRSWRALGCRDAGRIDIRLDRNGMPNFMEVNPLAGLNPVHSDLPILARMRGIDFDELIQLIMQKALQRIKNI